MKKPKPCNRKYQSLGALGSREFHCRLERGHLGRCGAVHQMTGHDLKVWPEYYYLLKSGVKPFDIRIADRNYDVGDDLILREWNPDTHSYTDSQPLRFTVTYLMRGPLFGLKKGWVIMGLSKPHAAAQSGAVSEQKILSVAFAASQNVCDQGDVNSRQHNSKVIAQAIRDALA